MWIILTHFNFSVKFWCQEILKRRILLLHKEFISSTGVIIEFISTILRISAIRNTGIFVYQSVSMYT